MHGLIGENDWNKNKFDSQVPSRDNPREPLLLNAWAISLDQLGYENTNLIEKKRPRTPLKMPHLRYRARIWRES